ncbi:hypothetical protein TFLX_02810 [Thermoflexales bacterium]|nr:hypothetical protein TFLX_02810 [Thermoflexales bacterium]
MTARLLRISRAATLVTLVVMAWQVSLPLALPQFDTARLPLPYLAPAVPLAEITALIAINAYALAGWPNRDVIYTGWRRVFALTMLGLILFAALSITWSLHQGLAAIQVLHVAIWAAFTLLIACADWSPASMTSALLSGVLLHSIVGFIQIGLRPVVAITPQNSGISVVFNGTEHWQRVYGLSPHPNLLGGHLAVSAILTVGLILTQQRRKRFLLSMAWLIIWFTLLLTFSRSAWLAVIGGSVVAMAFLIRGRHLTRSLSKPLMILSGLGMMAIVIFGVWFQPFLANRLDVRTIPYEMQAITGRLNSARLALQIFTAHPVTGVGLAQSIVALRDQFGTAIDWIHNVPLLIAAELGGVGIVLSGSLLMALLAMGARRWQTRTIALGQALIGGALGALLIVMQFDHYAWTTAQGGLLWAWLVGWWLRAETSRRCDHATES